MRSPTIGFLLIPLAICCGAAESALLSELSLKQPFENCNDVLDVCDDRFRDAGCLSAETMTLSCCEELECVKKCIRTEPGTPGCDDIDEILEEALFTRPVELCEDFDECAVHAPKCAADNGVGASCRNFDDVRDDEEKSETCCKAYDEAIKCVTEEELRCQEDGFCEVRDFAKYTEFADVGTFCRDGLNPDCGRLILECAMNDSSLSIENKECVTPPDFGKNGEADCCQDWEAAAECNKESDPDETDLQCGKEDIDKWQEELTKVRDEFCQTESPSPDSRGGNETESAEGDGQSSVGERIGIVAGVIAAIILVGIVLFCLVKRRRSGQQTNVYNGAQQNYGGGVVGGQSYGGRSGAQDGYVPAEFAR